MIHTHTFRGLGYRTTPGRLHPQYSIDCFDGDEANIREKYWLPNRRDVVLDVGASYGAYTLTALARGAHVAALEPERSIYEDLWENIKLNCAYAGCAAWNYGLSDKEETIDMREVAPHWPAHTITHPYQMRRLDDLPFVTLDWIKIDVEGMEEKVLRGGQETIKRCRPKVLCECHSFIDKDMVEKCKSLLTGYTFEVLPPHHKDVYMMVATP